MASYYDYRSASTYSNSYNQFNAEKFIVPYGEYRPIFGNSQSVPLIFKPTEYDDSGIQKFSSFPTAYNRIFRDYNEELKPIQIGKSETMLYVNRTSAFKQDKTPLYIKAYKGTASEVCVLLSSDFLFMDNPWCNNMRLKIFRVFKNQDRFGVKVIIDDELLKNMVIKPSFNVVNLDVSKSINDFLKSNYGKQLIAEKISQSSR